MRRLSARGWPGYHPARAGRERCRPSIEQPGAKAPASQEFQTMSKKIVLGLVLVSAFAACQRQQPANDVFVPTAPAMGNPVTTEPVYQGKFG
jgi:hypothetical protein